MHNRLRKDISMKHNLFKIQAELNCILTSIYNNTPMIPHYVVSVFCEKIFLHFGEIKQLCVLQDFICGNTVMLLLH